jgi:mediator of RNA polymerase II transcription subunit 5
MVDDISLHRVVSRCLRQDVTPKTFISLFNQLNQINTPNDDEYITELLEIQPPKNYNQRLDNSIKIRFAIELSLSNDRKLSQFWRCLAKSDLQSQIIYLRQYNSLLIKSFNKVDKVILKLLLNIYFSEYILVTIGLLPDDLLKSQQDLLYSIVIMAGQLYDRLSYMIYKDDEKLQLVFKQLSSKLQAAGLNDLNQLWIDLIQRLICIKNQYDQNSTNHNNDVLITVNNKRIKSFNHHLLSKSLLLHNINQDKLDKFMLLKEYIWFIQLLKTWKLLNDNSKILNLYLQNFIDIKDRRNLYLITTKLLKLNFIGLAFAIINNVCGYLLYNWKNFIASRLPKLLANLKFNDDESLEKAVINTFNSFNNSTITIISDVVVGSKKQYDLRQCFIKSCILNKLITMHSFQKIFPLDSKTNQQILVNELGQANHELHLSQKFNEKLLNVNPEFVSLMESELIEYIDSLLIPLEYLEIKQKEFSNLVLNILQKLIVDKNDEKIFRLLISLLNNDTILKLVIFNLGPYQLLNPLIDYIDQQQFNCEDEENFQDHYSYFGVILLTIISIVDTFKLNIDKVQIKKSFVIDYINNFYFSLGGNLTNQIPDNCTDEDKTIGENYTNLLSDWINALFDDDNDGLSDDLIKSITIKQIYKLIPIVYQQAVVACRLNKINFSILTGGIDYLTQMFLIPCTVSIINWLLNEMLIDKYKSESIPIKVLYEILKSNLGELNDSSDSDSDNDINKLIFKVVLKTSGSYILQSLKLIKNWEESSTIKNIVNMITKHITFDYVGTDKSFKNNIQPDINIDEEIKKSFKEGIVKKDELPIAGLDIQLFFLYMTNNKFEFIKLFLNEIYVYLKTNDEDSKILINIGVFLVVNSSINSTEEKAMWLNTLIERPKLSTIDLGTNQDDKFMLTMDYHYSSIFDDSNNTDRDYDKADDDMFGNFIDDADLHNDRNEKPTSIVLQKLLQEYEQDENLLSTLQNLRYQYHENHRLYKPIMLFTDKVIEEITNLTW